MNFFNPFCPHCHTQLQIKESEQERYAAKCPSCNQIVVVNDYGRTLSKPCIYKCPKCGKEHMFYEPTKGLICDGCGSFMLASEKGFCLIDPMLLQRGDDGEIPYTKKIDKKVQRYNKWLSKSSGEKAGIIGGFIVAIAAIMFAWYILTPCAIEKTIAYSNETELWAEFREKNPINYQTVGIREYSDNSFNVILSEPSPSISLKQLESFIKRYNGKVFTHTSPMGIDGWLKDAVLCFNGVRASKMPKFRSELFRLLYGTDYKAVFEDFSEIAGHANYLKENINYQISAEELQKWFIDDKQVLISLNDNGETTLEDVLISAADGIYYTKDPGLVVWAINREKNLPYHFEAPARMFSLDADMILGAICRDNSIAIIGREREIPTHDLPPMRLETMKLLAATDKDELSQSYERNNIVAGKMSGGKDYAPILLSPELWHTEYGSMLNVTDQMLKSWSENGEIEYETFVYPKPYEWAFVKSAMRDLEVNELTYNWNTSGAGYALDANEDNPYSVYALNRTGSLPVSYIPGDTDDISEDDKVYQAEENAYDFFSGLASPELIKVVQYASLYQIFRNFDFRLQYEPERYSINTSSVEAKIKSALSRITQFDEAEKAAILSSVKEEFDEYDKELEAIGAIPEDSRTEQQKSQYFDLLLYKFFCDPNDIASERIKKFEALKSTVSEYSHYRLNARISHYLVNPRDIDYQTLMRISSSSYPKNSITDDEAAQYYAYVLLDEVNSIKSYNRMFHLFDLKDLRDNFINDNSDSNSNWIKCPTVVQSWSVRDSLKQEGGHNLDSHITPVKIDKSLSKGQCSVEKLPDGSKVIKISPADKGQITPSFLRNVERTGKIGKQKFTKTAQSPRSFAEVFQPKIRDVRGFNPSTQVCRVTRSSEGYAINGRITNDVDAFWKELSVAAKEEGAPSHKIVFENFSQDEVSMILDDGPAVIIGKGETSNALMSDLDFAHRTISNIDADGNITVTIPRKAKQIIIGSGEDQQVIPVREASMEICFPAASKNGWIKTLKQIFSDPNTGDWSLFRFKRAGEKNGLNPEEVKELKRYQFARNNIIYNYQADVFYIQPQIA